METEAGIDIGNRKISVFMELLYFQDYQQFDEYNFTWESHTDGVWVTKVIAQQSYRLLTIRISESEYADNYYFILRYHTSLDWLFMVVDKIEALKIDDAGFFMNERKGSGTIYYYNFLHHGKKIVEQHGKSRIQAIWKAVIEFIDWYNKQQQQV